MTDAQDAEAFASIEAVRSNTVLMLRKSALRTRELRAEIIRRGQTKVAEELKELVRRLEVASDIVENGVPK